MSLQRRKAYNDPIVWSREDEGKMLAFLRKEEFNSKKIMNLFPDRTYASIRSKVRKLRIKYDLFGSSYRSQKEDFTLSIAKKIKPKIVFDAYAGVGHQTLKWSEVANIVFASEKMKSKAKHFCKSVIKNGFKKKKSKKGIWDVFVKGNKKLYFYSGDAIDAAADLKVRNIKVSTIDLDTCGSTLPTLPLFLVLLKPKHVLVTHGEFHSMRFMREDVLRRIFVHRDISLSPFPIDVQKMCDELDRSVKISALRAHNETTDSFWLNLVNEIWLGGKFHGMLRRHYRVSKPIATADCINQIS